jgi:6-phosphogluconolactonase
MEICQYGSPDDVATAGAEFIHMRAVEAIGERNQFTFALSGGSTPWRMLSKLAAHDIAWDRVKIFQVDERVAADGDPERNLVHIQEEFADRISLPPENLYAMPVVSEDLDAAARQYEDKLTEEAGASPVLDVIHLGLGGDGHTASLVPGDPVLNTADRDVDITKPYGGRQRMTLTYPIINRARHILWLITGEAKADMLRRTILADRDIPAGRVSQGQATIVADAAALSIHLRNAKE